MDVTPEKRASIFASRENTEKTYNIAKIVGVSIVAISRVVLMKKETVSINKDAKLYEIARKKQSYR